jgi:hypothetical protein
MGHPIVEQNGAQRENDDCEEKSKVVLHKFSRLLFDELRKG